MRRRKDATDVALEEWAKQRRRIIGLDEFRTAREYVGPVRSTLGQRRDLHANSKSNGKRVQAWPEVYTGRTAQTVNRAYWQASPDRKDILDVHYVFPLNPRDKPAFLGVPVRTYYDLVNGAKDWLDGYMAAAP